MPILSKAVTVLVGLLATTVQPSNAASVSLAAATTPVLKTLIPLTALSSTLELEKYFDYEYPWGETHNGGAIMKKQYVSVKDKYLRLTSHYDGTGNYPYSSGAVHSKQTFAIGKGATMEFQASFRAPVEAGCQPSFWASGTKSWPPQIDLAEWKGTGKVSFNAFNTSKIIGTKDVEWPKPAEFHVVKNILKAEADGTTVSIEYYIDGKYVVTQYAAKMVGEPFYLIIDYQMLGSSGKKGPEKDTYFDVKDLTVVAHGTEKKVSKCVDVLSYTIEVPIV